MMHGHTYIKFCIRWSARSCSERMSGYVLESMLTVQRPFFYLTNIYNRLIINNDSEKHNYICKYNNLPTTCFGLIRPSSGWNTASDENYLFDLNVGGKRGTRSRLQISDAVFQPEDGRIRPKYVVGKLLYLQI